MTNPIAELCRGIVGGDWGLVCDAYFLLTGERLMPPAQGESANLQQRLMDIRKFVCDKTDHLSDVRLGDQPEQKGGVVPGPPSQWVPQVLSAEKLFPSDELSPEAPEPEPATPDTEEDRTPPANDYDKFKVEHKGAVRADGKRESVARPLGKGMTNSWKDDRTAAPDDIKESVRLSGAKTPEPRRNPAKRVKVACGRCHKEEMVEPIFAPRHLDAQDEGTTYLCNSCVGKGGD